MQPASGKDSGEGMANLTFTGSSELNDAFTRISEIPWPVTEQALDGMAKVAAAEIKSTGEYMGVRDDGGREKITFDGTRRRHNTSTRNAEIAFIQEYGKRGQDARPFMKTALEKNEALISEPAMKIVGEWIENEYKK